MRVALVNNSNQRFAPQAMDQRAEAQLRSTARGLRREQGQLEGTVRLTAGDGFIPFLTPWIALLRERPHVRRGDVVELSQGDVVPVEAGLGVMPGPWRVTSWAATHW